MIRAVDVRRWDPMAEFNPEDCRRAIANLTLLARRLGDVRNPFPRTSHIRQDRNDSIH